jgi:hypothetical protein
MLEITRIIGKYREGKTTKLIQDHLTDDCILVSNEMHVSDLYEMIQRVRDGFNHKCVNLISLDITDIFNDWYKENQEKFKGCTTLLIDGNNCREIVNHFLKEFPITNINKIVYTEQQTISGNISF